MYLDNSAATRIARILSQIDIPALLMDEQGNVLLPEGDRRQLTLPEAVKANPSEPLVYGGVTLIGARSEHSTREDQQLYLCLSGDGVDARNCAILISELIGMILRVDMGHTDRTQALRLILRGEFDASELEALAAAHDLPMEAPRCVVYIHSQSHTSETLMQKLGEMEMGEGEIMVDVGRHIVAMVKMLPSMSDVDALANLAKSVDALFEDAGIDAVIGVSDARTRLSELPEAFNEAREAINVGSIYRASEHIFVYRRLLLERFLNTVPAEAGEKYGQMVMNTRTSRLFSDEMVHTIEVFFENNLNLSEAARKLYIHRNTLVYRLEKVQRVTGFDLRQFDDAVTFKLMMLISRAGGRRTKG